ncbi:MAG TPA: TIGR03086 family metal-binding protein [Actinomycetota bacterium]|nr:TIGR03086 family metal-binding protein [Actinomycetota bacterium]
MTAVTGSLELLAGTLAQTDAIIAGVRPEQATLPTPCRSWDVRALVNHVVHDVQQFTVTVHGGEWAPGDADVAGDDWAGAYREAASSLLEAWRRPGVLEQTVRLPFGEFPGTWRVGQQIADLAVHGWDIAKATGQPTDLDPEVGQLALDWGRENLKPQFRGDEASGQSFGAEVAVPDDAPLYDRLAGFFGRDPS